MVVHLAQPDRFGGMGAARTVRRPPAAAASQLATLAAVPKFLLPPEQEALRRRAVRTTVGFAVATVAALIGGIFLLAATSNDRVNGLIALCGTPFGAFVVYLGLRLLRRGARTGDYSPPQRGLP